MLSEATDTVPADPARRAQVAALTLRLRGLNEEIATLELEAERLDPDSSRLALRARLAHLLEQRERELSSELEQARTAASRVAAAAAAASAAAVASPAMLASELDPGPAREAAGRSTPDSETPARAAAAPATLSVDPDALAAAIAAALDAHAARRDDVRAVDAPASPTPPPAPKSFWNHALQPDVVLSVVALAIVMIILIAWST